MPVTMDDIAKQVGVSKAAVSLALNNKPGISPDLQDIVLKTADELGYRLPDRRSVKRASGRKSIAVVHQEHPDSGPQPAPIFSKYLEGIQAFIGDQDINLNLITNYGSDDTQSLGFQLLEGEQLGLDGIILMGLSAHREGRIFHRFLEKEMPMVIIGRKWIEWPVNTVGQDHYLHAALAMDHLVELGHRKIAFVGREVEPKYDWFAKRLECYKDTLVKMGEPVDESLIVLAEGAGEADAVKTLVKQRPDITAVFATNDRNAISIMRGLRETGLQVPRDISVIGLDDAVESPPGFPGLTTVGLPMVEMGYLAAELLMKNIENRYLHYAHIVVRSELIERESCAPPPSPSSSSPVKASKNLTEEAPSA